MRQRTIYPTLQLTDACNKQCAPCLRSVNRKSFSLGYGHVETYLKDLDALSHDYKIGYQFITGGEPTIWQDGDKDIVDVLQSFDRETCVRGLVVPTNGRVFEKEETARSLLGRLAQAMTRGLILGVSIADYQENFDDQGCLALDNVLRVSRRLDMSLLTVIMVTLSVSDDTSVRLLRRYPSLVQRVSALAPLGRAAKMKGDCPSLSLRGKDKSSLGSFLPFFKSDVHAKLGISDSEFHERSNAEIMDRLSMFNNCGRSPFVDKRWHYCLPFIDDPDFDLCDIGELRRDTLNDFLARNSLVRSFKEKGILTTLHDHRGRLSKESAVKLEEMLSLDHSVSVAYRGCMICKELHDKGIAQELREKMSSISL